MWVPAKHESSAPMQLNGEAWRASQLPISQCLGGTFQIFHCQLMGRRYSPHIRFKVINWVTALTRSITQFLGCTVDVPSSKARALPVQVKCWGGIGCMLQGWHANWIGLRWLCVRRCNTGTNLPLGSGSTWTLLGIRQSALPARCCWRVWWMPVFRLLTGRPSPCPVA